MSLALAKKSLLTIALSGLLLGSCGGGATDDGGGIGGSGVTGISFGGVNEFGSIWVNGVRFETTGAEIFVDGQAVGVGDDIAQRYLAVGKQVRVEGMINGDYRTGQANRVLFDDDIEGPIESVHPLDENTIEIEVLKQRVVVDDTTVILGFGRNLVDGVMVEISGAHHPDGGMRATHVTIRSDDFVGGLTPVEVKGVVSSFSDQTFDINGLKIDYASIPIDELPAGLGDGAFVDVRGTYDGGGTLTARFIEPESDLGAKFADRAEIEGFITEMAAPDKFTVSAQPVQVLSDTQFEGGLMGELRPGRRIEVEGALFEGILIADEVSFSYEIELEGDVGTVDPKTQTLILTALPGLTISADSQTEIGGSVALFGEINVGDHVKVRGRMHSGEDVVVARGLDVGKDPDPNVVIQGAVTEIGAPVVTILGVEVDTTLVPDDNFEGVDDQPTSREGFFQTVRIGHIVRAQGALSAVGNVMWQEIELEDDDG